jgi:hypothetical protein
MERFEDGTTRNIERTDNRGRRAQRQEVLGRLPVQELPWQGLERRHRCIAWVDPQPDAQPLLRGAAVAQALKEEGADLGLEDGPEQPAADFGRRGLSGLTGILEVPGDLGREKLRPAHHALPFTGGRAQDPNEQVIPGPWPDLQLEV